MRTVFFRCDTEIAADGIEDPGVGLMRDEPVDLHGADLCMVQSPAGAIAHHPDCLGKHVTPIAHRHQALFCLNTSCKGTTATAGGD